MAAYSGTGSDLIRRYTNDQWGIAALDNCVLSPPLIVGAWSAAVPLFCQHGVARAQFAAARRRASSRRGPICVEVRLEAAKRSADRIFGFRMIGERRVVHFSTSNFRGTPGCTCLCPD